MPDSAPSPPSSTTSAPVSAAKQENPLANILLNVLLPVTVLSMCSKLPGPDSPIYSLGPKGALIAAIALPVGYQIYDYIQRRKWNMFSLIGMVSVLLTGGLGLLRMSAQAFAWKEASIPLILGSLIYLSSRTKKPLVRALLLNPEIFDVAKVERSVDAVGHRTAFERLLHTSSLLLAGTMFMSAALNYFLAIHFLTGTEHDEQLYNAAIAKQTGWGWVVIGVPSMAMMLFAMFRLFKGLKRLTGLETDQLMLPR